MVVCSLSVVCHVTALGLAAPCPAAISTRGSKNLDASTSSTMYSKGQVPPAPTNRRRRRIALAVAGVVIYTFYLSAQSRLPLADHTVAEAGLRAALETCQQRTENCLAEVCRPVAPPVQEHMSYAAFDVPDQTNCSLLDDSSEFLPDFIHIPFETAVAEDTLKGWEDEWVALGTYDVEQWGRFDEPRMDFVYLWVNGSDVAFQQAKRPYEQMSVLNDAAGHWLQSHGVNRYRDWDELRYSVRSLARYAPFRNQIQLLVNGVGSQKQVPSWLQATDAVQVLSQEDYFEADKRGCLPTFNSLTMENQIFNTPSDVDRFVALSDDMLLGKPHAASDIYSPLFGPVLSFKTAAWSLTEPPTAADAQRFGEKPYLAYTSWLLNKRFGERKRRGQAHFGHSLSRRVMRETLRSFPRPERKSACRRFRGEPGFQIYSWYAAFHYLIERHREVLLWSYLLQRSDADGDGHLGWAERQQVVHELEEGMANEGKSAFRARNFYSLAQTLNTAGLEPPRVNTDVVWTALDGPATIQDIECTEFDVDTCLAPGFSMPDADPAVRNPMFSSAAIFDRVARQDPRCGDCLIKLILNRVRKGLDPLLPHRHHPARAIVVKALMRYHYSIVNPDALFVMVTDAEQVDNILVQPMINADSAPTNQVGQLCLNDDVATDDPDELLQLKRSMHELYEGLFPGKSPWEG